MLKGCALSDPARRLRDGFPGEGKAGRGLRMVPLPHELWHEYDDMARIPPRFGQTNDRSDDRSGGRRHDRNRKHRPPKPLDDTRLEELALAYAARFATTAAKLKTYLARKLRERGYAGEEGEEPDLDALVARFVDKGWVDDEVYARARSNDLLRRGYGGRRVNQALHAAGIDEDLREEYAPDEATAREAVLALARKRRFGPFDRTGMSGDEARKRHEKQLAALVRAGHGFDHARICLDAKSEAELEDWVDEARNEQRDEPEGRN